MSTQESAQDCVIGAEVTMTFKRATRSPVVVVGLIIAVVCILQVISRPVDVAEGRSRGFISGFFEQIEMLTYDGRQKVASAFKDPDQIAKNMAVVFFDDKTVGEVNSGG